MVAVSVLCAVLYLCVLCVTVDDNVRDAGTDAVVSGGYLISQIPADDGMAGLRGRIRACFLIGDSPPANAAENLLRKHPSTDLDSRHHTTSASTRFLLVHTARVPSPRFPALDPRPSTDPRLPLGTRLEQRWCVIDFARPLQRPINEYCAAGSNPLYTRYACTVLELEHLY